MSAEHAQQISLQIHILGKVTVKHAYLRIDEA